MITVLERQHIRKRPSSALSKVTGSRDADSPVGPGAYRIRARSIGVQWRSRAPKAAPASPPRLGGLVKRQHPTAPSFLTGQRVAGKRRGPRRLESAARSPRRLAAVLKSPWLLITLAVLLLLAVLLPAALSGRLVTAIRQSIPTVGSRPAVPQPDSTDPDLYRLLIPEDVPPQTPVEPVVKTLALTKYTIKPGDSVGAIASSFKVAVDTVLSWNEIQDARRLTVGTTLEVPNLDGLKYTVRRGDTLETIARRAGVELNAILDWNQLASPVISVGQELFLPGAHMDPTDLGRILGTLFQYPVLGRISSYFGNRPDPFTGVVRFHNGLDIVNRPGTPIRAAMAGTVADAAFNANYGNYVILRHPGNYQTLYGHLTRSVVVRNQKVSQGQVIGELGTTGYSTGPHLHFSIFRNLEPVDPLRYLK
ncbi:MAG TPA: peptidoglycan DD-metalloendopeptidase family protein [Spirochaetia bacterium]|nr:peptidoglycan DD-metalloendopeptidase family protein [Spirochaetia bacterium]